MVYYSKTTVIAVATTVLTVGSAAFWGRMFLRLKGSHRSSRPNPEDYTITAAYVFFLALCTCQLIVMPAKFEIADVTQGRKKPDADFAQVVIFHQKMFALAATEMYWWSVWMVKLTLLLLFRKLMIGLPPYLRAWWVVLAYCVLALLGTVLGNIFSCNNPRAYVDKPELCNTPAAARSIYASLIYSYFFDISTDILIMVLPIRLIMKLQLPTRQRIGVAATFAVGILCIVAATVRFASIHHEVSTESSSGGLLPTWTMIEAGTAIIVGCLPAYAVVIRNKVKSTKSGSAQLDPRKMGHSATIGSGGIGDQKSTKRSLRRGLWTEDSLLQTSSSQEDIIKKPETDIMVLRTLEVEGMDSRPATTDEVAELEAARHHRPVADPGYYHWR